MTFKINGKDVEVEARPPSKFYRSQFSRCVANYLGIDEDTKKLSIPITFMEQLDEESFKAVLKTSCDISFTDLNALDINESENYESAVKVMTAFFLSFAKTTSGLSAMTTRLKDSLKGTKEPTSESTK